MQEYFLKVQTNYNTRLNIQHIVVSLLLQLLAVTAAADDSSNRVDEAALARVLNTPRSIPAAFDAPTVTRLLELRHQRHGAQPG